MLLTISKPEPSVMMQAGNSTCSPVKPQLLALQTKKVTTAAAAGLGSPKKSFLPPLIAVSVLKRASRNAAQAV